MKKHDWSLIISVVSIFLAMLFLILFAIAAIGGMFSTETAKTGTLILLFLLATFFLVVASLCSFFPLLGEVRMAVEKEYKQNPDFAEKSTEAVYEFLRKRIKGKKGLGIGLTIYLLFADILPPVKKALFRHIKEIAQEKAA